MKALYAMLKIKVKAEKDEIDANPLGLDNKLFELMERLEGWLERQDPPFSFELIDMDAAED